MSEHARERWSCLQTRTLKANNHYSAAANRCTRQCGGPDLPHIVTFAKYTLLEEKVLYRTLKGSISATYLEPLKGSIQNPF